MGAALQLRLLLPLLCLAASCHADNKDKLRPLTHEELTKFMSDFLSIRPSAQQCPAPRVPIPQSRCKAKQCARDTDCTKQKMCCFNGCVFTCLQKIAPPPVIDWVSEPPVNISSWQNTVADNESGNTQEEVVKGMSCSPAPLDPPSVPLKCPEGMICSVKEIGDPLKGVPTLGECIPDPVHFEDQREDDGQGPHERIGKETVFLHGGCMLTKSQFEMVESFQRKPYITGCSCRQGSVECNVKADKNGLKYGELHSSGKTI